MTVNSDLTNLTFDMIEARLMGGNNSRSKDYLGPMRIVRVNPE